MAEQNAVAIDYVDHLKTYHSFLKLSKYGTAGVIILLILMAFFLL